MPLDRLDILLVSPDDDVTSRLVDRLSQCSRPAVGVTRASSLERASAAASAADFDVAILDIGLAPGAGRGFLMLPTVLHTLPIVLSVPEADETIMRRSLPEGVADYIRRDSDSPHVLERLLLYASQRYETLRSIREAESRLRSIVEAISDGVLIVDDGGIVLFANPAAETVLMRPLFEILGAGIGFDLPDPSPSVVDLYSHRHDPIRLHVHVGELMWESRPARLVTLRDVTTQVAIEDNLKRARDDAERVANLKTAFLANMSHELRMPLASIIGFAQIIRDGLGDHEFQEFAENIIQSGNRLLETITSVLDLTRLDANAVQSHARPVSVASVAREAVGMLASLATRKGLPVRIEPSDLDDTIHADPAVLRRILNNLIGNAIKFTDSGSVTVRIEADSSFVRIHVIDTGTGISPEFIPQLFDEFTQESSGYDRSHEGSGLGLAITRRLCALIGAEIGVESRRGEGSTFTVVVPHADAWTD